MLQKVGVLGLLVLAVSGCYHATVETGLPPSNQTLEKHWASGWIGGLVPPSAVETAERCPDGVAKVETKLSFLNQVVAVITLGIYTPMYIEVCMATVPLCPILSFLSPFSPPSLPAVTAGGRFARKRSGF